MYLFGLTYANGTGFFSLKRLQEIDDLLFTARGHGSSKDKFIL